MFYMRKNGMRSDAVREQIAAWKDAGQINDLEEACLVAPLLYQACYTSNTSGVFKGFHNGWGGQTKTALYRIATDLRLDVPVLHDNGQENVILRGDAAAVADDCVRTSAPAGGTGLWQPAPASRISPATRSGRHERR